MGLNRAFVIVTLVGIAAGFGTPADAGAAPQSAGLVFEQVATDGLVVVEAENFGTNVPVGPWTWTEVMAPAGYVGAGAMQALPDGQGSYNTGYETNSPRLDFRVAFQATGTHYIWVRGVAIAGVLGTSDSCHTGLDGAVIATADRLNSFSDTGFTWRNMTIDGEPCSFDVATKGVHTVNLWMREDGFTVDRILITTTPNYMPEGDGGTGPGESNQIPDPALPAVTGLTAMDGPASALLAWTAVGGATSYTVLRGSASGGPYTTVASGVTSASYTDPSLVPGTTYYYVVQGVNAFGTGPDSNEAFATPFTPPPRPDGEDDGVWDGDCGCSAIGAGLPSMPLSAALLSLLGVLLAGRRKA